MRTSHHHASVIVCTMMIAALAATGCSRGAQPASDSGKVVATPGAGAEFKVVRYADLKWEQAFPGVEAAVVSGNPDAAGPYVMLIKCADGAGLKPHRHPTSGTAVVLKGTYMLGLGEQYDPSRTQEVNVGDYVYAPPNVAHFDVCKGETVLYVQGVGPFGISWVNPADDPSKAAKPQ